MSHTFCPGSSALRQPKPENIACTQCGAEVEIWSDEIKARCPACGREVVRTGNVSCIEWCAMARECVGVEVYNGYMRKTGSMLRQKLLDELRAYFGEDDQRIRHAEEVLKFAEQLMESEGGEWHIVIPASILHDVGIKAAEEKYGLTDGFHQQLQGPPVARKILLKLGRPKKQIDEICDIIANHHTPRALATANFKILYDADCLVSIRERFSGKTNEEIEQIIDGMFLTPAGNKLAKHLYASA